MHSMIQPSSLSSPLSMRSMPSIDSLFTTIGGPRKAKHLPAVAIHHLKVMRKDTTVVEAEVEAVEERVRKNTIKI